MTDLHTGATLLSTKEAFPAGSGVIDGLTSPVAKDSLWTNRLCVVTVDETTSEYAVRAFSTDFKTVDTIAEGISGAVKGQRVLVTGDGKIVRVTETSPVKVEGEEASVSEKVVQEIEIAQL